MTKILLVITGSDYLTLKNGAHSTGYWAEEVIAPYDAFRQAGVDVDIVTPEGLQPTVDEASLTPEMNGGDNEKVAYLRDYLSRMSAEIDHPGRLEEVADRGAADYNAIYLPGGHGPMEDLPGSEPLGRILINMCDGDKPVLSVCHGPAGLFAAQRGDRWPFEGYQLTGFTNEEEQQTGLAEQMPWLLETQLREHGADFQAATAWQPHVVVDRNLITGQNPQSSKDAAERLLEMLRVTVGT